jgi:hypothetical protein
VLSSPTGDEGRGEPIDGVAAGDVEGDIGGAMVNDEMRCSMARFSKGI